MCLYPKLILNPKYKPNKKNGFTSPLLKDHRVKYVPIGCKRCIECCKQKAREWQIRMLEDIKTNKNGKFVTLTISNEQYAELTHEIDPKIEGYNRDNEIARIATRRFLERWRKQYGKSLRHWLVTELGHNGTENVHMHGIIWTNEIETIDKIWKYGYVWKGNRALKRIGRYITEKWINYVNEKTVSYITKYVTKQDAQHTNYQPKIFCSAGIGNNYTNTMDARNNKFQPHKTRETYRTSTGHKVSLPIYWRNKIYTDEERELLWLEKLDKQERWVCGEKICIKNGEKNYYNILQFHRNRNKQLGYGNDEKNWSQIEYENQLRNLKHKERIKKATIKRYRNLSKTSTAQLFKGKHTRLWVWTQNGICEYKTDHWTITKPNKSKSQAA